MVKITLSKSGIPKDQRKLFRHAATVATRRALEDWREDILPKHFEPGAARKYKYHKRSEKYQKRKNRMGKRPLVFSGRTKQLALGDKRPAKGENKKIILSLKSERYVHIKKPGWPHRVRDEVVILSNKELKDMGKQIETDIANQMNNHKAFEKMVL